MSDILAKTMFMAGMAATAAKSAASYYFRGPRCPKWPLSFQVRRDMMFSVIVGRSGWLPTEADIEHIDFEAIAKGREKWDLPTSELPPEMGAFQPASITCASIDIDVGLFVGAGPAESGLCALVEEDRLDGGRRALSCEITAPASMLLALKDAASVDRAFGWAPVCQDEKIVLFLHGGAYRFGSPASHRGLAGRLSGMSDLRCVSIDYRLAPSHPYPAQLHDAFIAFVYLMQQGFKPENIVLVGDSAGGNLALALLFLLRHTGIAHKVCGLLLISPWSDLVSYRSSMERNASYDYLTAPPLSSPLAPARMFYAPGRKYSQALLDEMSHPLVSPINGDFRDFPPTLIQAGDKEILADDIAQLHENLLRDNPEHSDRYIYECYTDMIHVFHQFKELPDARDAFASAAKFLGSL
ncbi:hypothetical protein H4R26_002112 [Coemansia thaxteri]|uniref:Alpha/beta hydrolase fold-3 domain-containing protein n=1 Tax=Coemansia thaxteri TaxID=2663907 RepID=A0A9W8BDH1_9FUNG|nr:hypothetical protein H4R26_002112 [Coemansia thaxteri]KAJ2484868.1 hypothetical protein EV174_002110 [Coemansia sp. RSA 2320]